MRLRFGKASLSLHWYSPTEWWSFDTPENYYFAARKAGFRYLLRVAGLEIVFCPRVEWWKLIKNPTVH